MANIHPHTPPCTHIHPLTRRPRQRARAARRCIPRDSTDETTSLPRCQWPREARTIQRSWLGHSHRLQRHRWRERERERSGSGYHLLASIPPHQHPRPMVDEGVAGASWCCGAPPWCSVGSMVFSRIDGRVWARGPVRGLVGSYVARGLLVGSSARRLVGSPRGEKVPQRVQGLREGEESGNPEDDLYPGMCGVVIIGWRCRWWCSSGGVDVGFHTRKIEQAGAEFSLRKLRVFLKLRPVECKGINKRWSVVRRSGGAPRIKGSMAGVRPTEHGPLGHDIRCAYTNKLTSLTPIDEQTTSLTSLT